MNHKRTPLEGGGGLRNNSNFITRFDWERGWSGNAPNLVVVNLSSENECDTILVTIWVVMGCAKGVEEIVV